MIVWIKKADHNWQHISKKKIRSSRNPNCQDICMFFSILRAFFYFQKNNALLSSRLSPFFPQIDVLSRWFPIMDWCSQVWVICFFYSSLSPPCSFLFFMGFVGGYRRFPEERGAYLSVCVCVLSVCAWVRVPLHLLLVNQLGSFATASSFFP